MKKIKINLLNPSEIESGEKMAVAMARLTQSGEKIHSVKDFQDLYNRNYTEKFVNNLVNLPHPTLQKFAILNVLILGASRRFLAQVTRHQNEVKFMSASFQYSDYTDSLDYVVPYELLDTVYEEHYLNWCKKVGREYEALIEAGINHDDASFLLPQSTRNVLVISATLYQWKHMIKQRTCRRNSKETRYVFLLIQEQLEKLSPTFMKVRVPCCDEGHMTCGNKMVGNPTEILKEDFRKVISK